MSVTLCYTSNGCNDNGKATHSGLILDQHLFLNALGLVKTCLILVGLQLIILLWFEADSCILFESQ